MLQIWGANEASNVGVAAQDDADSGMPTGFGAVAKVRVAHVCARVSECVLVCVCVCVCVGVCVCVCA